MKKIYIAFFLSFTAFSFSGCLDFDEPTDDFQETDIKLPDVVYQGKADSIDYLKEYSMEQVKNAVDKLKKERTLEQLNFAQYGLLGHKNGEWSSEAHEYQRQFALTEMLAQYGVMPHYDYAFGSEIKSAYAVSRSWLEGPNGHFLDQVKRGLTGILNHPTSDTIPEFKATGLLLYDFMAAYNTDMYGPFPYQDFKNNKQGSSFTYDATSSIYKTIVANIDTIVKVYKHYEQRPKEYQKFIQRQINGFTVVNPNRSKLKGFDTWRRFANSLKLRLAMHIVKVEPQLAKQWAEEAVKDGVIESHDQEFGAYPNNYSGANPILKLYDWGDMRLSASFESMLKSLNHPYAHNLYLPNQDKFVDADGNVTLKQESAVVGLRAGLRVGKGQGAESNPYLLYSKLNAEFVGKAPIYLIKLAEVQFLRAEGALRGWNMGGSAEYFYRNGVINSGILDYNTDKGKELQAKLEKYYELDQAVDFTYIDPLGNVSPSPSVTKIGVKWNEGDSKEMKLEKIITQKYIALFPNSFEAWTEMRRTGYPKVFPVLNVSDGDGSLNDGDLIRRLLFPNTDDASLKDIKRTGIPALGGPDRQGTRLWWDVKGVPNI